MLQAILLDLDGTLLASNDAQALAWEEAFHSLSLTIPFSHIRPLMGMGADQLVPTLFPSIKEKKLISRIATRQEEIYCEKYLSHIQPTYGAIAFIEKLQLQEYDISLATSASSRLVDRYTKLLNASFLKTNAIASDDIESSKPAPDIIAKAIQKQNLNPLDVMMVGDTRFDIECAAKNNVKTTALLCGGNSRESLAGAAFIYKDPNEIMLNFEKSPFC